MNCSCGVSRRPALERPANAAALSPDRAPAWRACAPPARAHHAQAGPVHLGDLQVIGDAHIGDGHARKPLVVQLSFHRRRDHPLDQRRDSCGARVRSCHKNPFPRLRGEPLTISLVSYSHIPYSKAHSESFSIRNMRGLRTLAHNRTKPKSPEFRPSAANTVHWRKTGGSHEP